ncbi:hypothetical protein ACFFMR_29165 [Micromonospora andamanensis]|uniref:Uncharacterized protein n=1 Tax=Micromonospora andamanensis TaxID=1287068 RepID=A0ABQ4HS22_9ACTN|nr:hypothetical protein [Micromonospora andamanensis]GIJ08441.1 hypothetical protein Van01_16550 [Micromonospora andamanensis]
MYRYLLTFTHTTNGQTQFTALDYPTARPISSVDDVQLVTLHLQTQGYNSPFVIAFSLFTDPAPTLQATS